MTEQEAIRRLWDFGHFANPGKPNAWNIEEDDLPALKFSDPEVKDAVASYQDFLGDQFDAFAFDHHARVGIVDGEVGPATQDLLKMERCAVPDYLREPLPAVGTGGWARCHGVGNFHRATVYINHGQMPGFLKPVWPKVWANTVASYRELGLDFVETQDASQHNTSLSFVGSSSGWIGLAIVGRNQSCGSKIWARFLATYRGGSSEASITTQWTSLIKHELGHNTGLGHSRGGVMNPSIVNGLPVSWKGDPSETLLRRWFGGEPIPGGNPDPPEPPPPPSGGGSAPRVSLSVTVPEGFKPGTYDLVAVPRPQV